MMSPRAFPNRISHILPMVVLCGMHCGTRVINAIDLGPTFDSGLRPTVDSGLEPSVDSGGSNSSPSTPPDAGLDAAGPSMEAPPPRTDLVWPNPSSSANSDAWLVAHHDEITEMRPNVLALDFYNRASPDEARTTVVQMIDAIAQGSRYHGYSDATAPPFLVYRLAGLVDLTDSMPQANSPSVSSSRVPVTSNNQFDINALFTSSFASNYNIPDPNNPNRYLTLCELFEHGIINELWLLVGEPGPRTPLMVESKQEYDAQNHPIPNSFNSCTGYVCLPSGMPHCSVTARIAHLDPTRPGPGCDLLVRSIGIENMRFALQYLQNNASDFFNDDFKSRYGTDFDSWTELVSMGMGSAWCTALAGGGACISYPSQTTARGTYPDGGTWKIDPFIQGCGNAHFPPNAQFLWDYSNSQSSVQSRCENYGMHNGPDGGDRTDVYTSATSSASAPSTGDRCGDGWQTYLRQSMPGLGNSARAVDGSPMKNWWPFLFY